MKITLLLLALGQLAAAAILAIDYGTEWTKAALVKPGIPLEIVLTKDTKRKEQSVVAFKGNERLYGTDAANMAARSPAQTFPALKTLLGQSFDSDATREFLKLFPANKVVKTSRNSVAFEHAEGTFTVEELVAMEFINIRKNAESMAEGQIRDAILTVPAFFNQAQRLAILDAAKLAGLRPIELVNDGLAVAVDYAKSRTFDEPQNHIIFDMGAGSTTATIVKLATKSVKDVGRFNKTVTTVDVLGAGFDTIASGNAMTERLYDFLVTEFDASNSARASTKISDNSRATARLLKEATRVKQVLSANHEAMVSVESLHEDIDFRLKVTRAKFEELTSDLVPRSTKPITDALNNAGLHMDEISSLVLHGGAARVPFVQKALLEVIQEEKIARNVNADEAAVMGAVFRGAGLSGSFRVKELLLQDISLSTYTYSTNTDLQDRSLFDYPTSLGSEKNISFPDQKDDFVFRVAYGQAETPAETCHLASFQISSVLNTTNSLSKEFGCKSPVVTVAAVLDHFGIVRVPASFAICEVPEDKQGVADKVKGWFGGKNNASATASSTASSKLAKASTEPSEPVIKTVQKRAEFQIATDYGSVGILDETEVKDSLAKIKKYDEFDSARIARETARNALEAYIYKVRDFLENAKFLEVSSTEEQNKLKDLAAACNEWMYDEGEKATISELVAKKRDMTSIADPIQIRQKELTTRDDKISELQKQISSSRTFIKSQMVSAKEFASKKAARSLKTDSVVDADKENIQEDIGQEPLRFESTDDEESSQQDITRDLIEPAYTEQELNRLDERLDETESWLSEKLNLQNKLSITDDPILLTADLDKKISQVSDDFMSVLMKASYRQQSKPKPKTKSKSKSKSSGKDKKPNSDHKSKTSSEDAAFTNAAQGRDEDASSVEAEIAAAPADSAHVDLNEDPEAVMAAEPEPEHQPNTKDEL